MHAHMHTHIWKAEIPFVMSNSEMKLIPKLQITYYSFFLTKNDSLTFQYHKNTKDSLP